MRRLEENVPLERYSTLHVGGRARYFVAVAGLEELRHVLEWGEDRCLPSFILGGGANFFCRDEGFPGLVVKMENRGVTIVHGPSGIGHGEVTAEAGALTRVVVTRAVESGLRGMERLAGIPGTIGGAVRGNAGAFGMETKDTLTRARVLRRTRAGWEEDMLAPNQLSFGYRDSLFKRAPGEYVVWSASFALESGDRSAGQRLVAEDLAMRREKQPYEFPSVGSVFKNPAPDRPAGRLIEAAGGKGLRRGSAEVSHKHANFIVNRGGATATDACTLVADIERRVLDSCGIRLEKEIVVL